MLDQEGSNNLLNHILELWINPEIERRKNVGKLPNNFQLSGAQVVLFPDGRTNFVRLNREVKAILIGVAKRGIKVNEKFPLEDGIKEIKDIRLSNNDDPNAGHVTIIKFNGEWNIVFDFRYNKKKANDRFSAALEFLDTAKNNLEKELWRPFIDNLYSATELLATAQLLPHADEQYSKKQWHEGTQKRYISFTNAGNFRIEYKNTLLELRKLRKSARYVSSEFNFGKDEAEKYIKILDDMVNYTKQQIN